MRNSILLLLPLISTIGLAPASADPATGLASQLTQLTIQPIEIREVVISVRIMEVSESLEELVGLDAGEIAKAHSKHPDFLWVPTGRYTSYFKVIETVYGSLADAERGCAAGKGTLDGDCVAKTILTALSRSADVQKIIVRGWDYKTKESAARLKSLASKPTMAGAREALLAILIGLLEEGREIGMDDLTLGQVNIAIDLIEAWPKKWPMPDPPPPPD